MFAIWTARRVKAALVAMMSVSLLFAGACKSGKSQKSDEAPTESQAKADEGKKAESTAHQVTLYNYQFNPNTLTVEKGATVKFRNKDPEKHNVRIAALDIDQNIAAGESWTYTFETEGDFAVENRLLDKPMTMTIVVGTPEGGEKGSKAEEGTSTDKGGDSSETKSSGE